MNSNDTVKTNNNNKNNTESDCIIRYPSDMNNRTYFSKIINKKRIPEQQEIFYEFNTATGDVCVYIPCRNILFNSEYVKISYKDEALLKKYNACLEQEKKNFNIKSEIDNSCTKCLSSIIPGSLHESEQEKKYLKALEIKNIKFTLEKNIKDVIEGIMSHGDVSASPYYNIVKFFMDKSFFIDDNSRRNSINELLGDKLNWYCDDQKNLKQTLKDLVFQTNLKEQYWYKISEIEREKEALFNDFKEKEEKKIEELEYKNEQLSVEMKNKTTKLEQEKLDKRMYPIAILQAQKQKLQNSWFGGCCSCGSMLSVEDIENAFSEENLERLRNNNKDNKIDSHNQKF